ncbi:hypothetical protein FOA52_012435 [Chlamydomonas sp. UWO 241]|nr:hypothetical protein FOA52_012435 [Chlamydomonas sp. UWO 241]
MARISGDSRWSGPIRGRSVVVLSGGLDSAIIAEAGRSVLGLSAAVTVLCTDEDATDRPYATASAAAAGLEHFMVEVTVRELLERELPTCVRALRTFDPMTLRNEVAVCAALREAAARGFTCAVMGDAADELLGGYSFTHGLDDKAWAKSRDGMAALMDFGSPHLGAQFGMWVAQPYRDQRFVRAARTFGKAECIVSADEAAAAAVTASGCSTTGAALPFDANDARPLPKTMGKMPLRKAFPVVSSAWRRKDPIEVGCGTTALSRPGWWDSQISDEEWEREREAIKTRQGVALRDKEHLAYYRAFREVFPNGAIPGVARHDSDPCPACGYQMRNARGCFCHTCGHYDETLRGPRK